ncbi:MAG TPA: FecR domain-containing protein [Methylomirabilota bacterium]|nr:FecR domain-containing protein [Methylomirabilota bacterium]
MHLGLVMVLGVVAALVPVMAGAADIGRIKVVKGDVRVQRAAAAMPAAVGTRLQQGDVVVTGRDGAVGITLNDDSLLSAGPDSMLALDHFAFDSTTHAGRLETTLRRGTLAAVSGKIARQTPGAMQVRTPWTILGVRGTELAVRSLPAGP